MWYIRVMDRNRALNDDSWFFLSTSTTTARWFERYTTIEWRVVFGRLAFNAWTIKLIGPCSSALMHTTFVNIGTHPYTKNKNWPQSNAHTECVHEMGTTVSKTEGAQRARVWLSEREQENGYDSLRYDVDSDFEKNSSSKNVCCCCRRFFSYTQTDLKLTHNRHTRS